jgi:hypothetical protein
MKQTNQHVFAVKHPSLAGQLKPNGLVSKYKEQRIGITSV